MTDTKKIGITALRKKAKDLDLAIARAKRNAHDCPRVKEARRISDEAQDTYNAAVRAAEADATVDMREALKAVTELIQAHDEDRKKTVVEVPDHIADLLARCRRGVDYGPGPFRVLWASPKGRFFIMTNPGHCFWANMMEPVKYAPSCHYLIDCAGEGTARANHGSDIWRSIQVHETEGRLKKATKEEWMAEAVEAEVREPDAYLVSKGEGMRAKPITIEIWECQECGALYAKKTSCWCCIDMEGEYTGKRGKYEIVKLGEYTAKQIRKLRPFRK